MNRVLPLKDGLENCEKIKVSEDSPNFKYSTNIIQWDHPEYIRIIQELESFNEIKYAAYRTAMKLRHIQKMLKLHWIKISLINNIYENLGYSFQKHVLDYTQLQKLLCCIYTKMEGELSETEQAEFYSKILSNFLQNLFGIEKKDNIELSSVTIFLSILCSAPLIEKYKFIFSKFIGSNGFLSKKNLYIILYNIAKIPEILGEKLNFGTQLVSASVESCCKWNSKLNWISESGFLNWMKQEPQTLVWISTHFRLITAEKIEHFVKCEVCKIYPIIGLRYQCTYCIGYNLCQNCFFYGYTSKSHKLKHPLQEYCQPLSSWEVMKALIKSIQNKLSIFQRSTCKWNYLMIDSHLAITRKRELMNTKDETCSMKESRLLQTDSRGAANISEIELINNIYLKSRYIKELENIVNWLENENRHLVVEIERLHSDEETSNASNSSEENNSVRKRGELLNKRQLLEDHSHRLEVQIKKFRKLLENICEEGKNMENKHICETPMRNNVTNLESTPISNGKMICSNNLSTFIRFHNELKKLESVTEEMEESVKTIPDLKNLQIKKPSIDLNSYSSSKESNSITNPKEISSFKDANDEYTFKNLTIIQTLPSQSPSLCVDGSVKFDQSIEVEFQKIIQQLENILNYSSALWSGDTTSNFRKKLINALNQVEDVIEEFPIIEETKL
ncbi:dystrophin-like [Centruroides sculpturatus]|uniref:dystrophin-like n=2 Tax=Centruroides sculpturatus TaxID=218467 RepID=UPI000C6D980E|nr:dystrophin-like [Centruroides sculpturatus]